MPHYTREKLRNIAHHCDHFEHVIQAMGYGYSLVNVSQKNFIRSCDDCVHWSDGTCEIFKEFLLN